MKSRALRRIVCVAALAAACVAGVVSARGNRSASMTDPGLQARSMGPVGGVLLVEYSDFQCPSCKYARPYIQQLVKAYEGKVRFVFRHFPLDMHPRAFGAAIAAECAAYQGKFWPFHDQLFDQQEVWVAAADPRILFAQYAENLGLAVDKFQACLDGAAAPEAVKRDMAEGGAWDVNSTPTLFIGHRRLIGARQISLSGAGIIDKDLKGAP
jgi:protein-disulfide isomerase